MEQLDITKPIKVDSVREEYDIIGDIKCDSCGAVGEIRSHMQSLVFRENKPYDILNCECGACSKKYEITFDISSFFGKM
ncbi:MAG: hypothetical protein ACFFCS_03300 [Candidatus Hodarchaeota archaeon]